MSLDPEKVVINRAIYSNEYDILRELIKDIGSQDNAEEGYFYIDAGSARVRSTGEVRVTRFSENIILWLSDCFNISNKDSIYMEGAFPGLIFEYYMFLYDLDIKGIKRFVCLTDMGLVDEVNSILFPEIFCETLEQAVFYFTNVANIETIIDVYEEDDRMDLL